MEYKKRDMEKRQEGRRLSHYLQAAEGEEASI
jgi:hypothetical protein